MNDSSISEICNSHNTTNISELERLIKKSVKKIIEDPSQSSLLPPILIHGAPGLGKSTMVRDIAKELGIDFRDVRLTEIQSVDIRGLPSVDCEKGVMKWNPPDFWPRDENSKGILFFDEITSCARDCQVAAYEIIHDRKIGDFYHLPTGWYIVAAGNRVEDRAVATTMSSALANRFMHVELAEDLDGWVSWAQRHDINPSVIGFLNFRPGLLFRMDNENVQMGWPSPRSWEKVSRMIDVFKDDGEATLRKIVYGLVGRGAGQEFMEFYRMNSDFKNILRMMTDEKAEVVIPSQIDRQYAFCSAVSYYLWRGRDEEDEARRLDGFFRIIMKLPTNFATLLMFSAINGIDKKNIAHYSKALAHHPKYEDFGKKHGQALLKRYKIELKG